MMKATIAEVNGAHGLALLAGDLRRCIGVRK